MVWNSSIALSTCITSTTTSSSNFSVLIYVIGSLDPSTDDPISYTNLFAISNSNGNPFANAGLLTSTCSFDGLNTSKEGCGSTSFVCSSVACRPSCVCYCCYCKCCCKCCKCCGLAVVSIQSSYTSPSKHICSSPSGNYVSCTFLIP
jgi:hypothetical protein